MNRFSRLLSLRSLVVKTSVLPKIALALILPVMAGCNANKELLLESSFSHITVGQSTANEVLELLGEQGVLHTTSGVSVLREDRWAREVGIVQFAQADSLVRRKDYLQHRSVGWGLLTEERLYLQIDTIVPDDILDQPYETDFRLHDAIMRYCHQAMIADTKPFVEDRQTESLMGLGRTALSIGILMLTERPRQADKILTRTGFPFRHPTLGRCHLWLVQKDPSTYTVAVRATDWVDPFMVW